MARAVWAAVLIAAALPGAPERQGTAEVSGASLAWREAGAGPAVVLIHGSIADGRGWAAQLPSFARRHRVLVYSRRYHPPNPLPRGVADASTATQAEDLDRLLDARGIPSAHLIGHSYGGGVAVAFALAYPERVRSLILIEPGLRGPPEPRGGAAECAATERAIAAAEAGGDPAEVARVYGERFSPGSYDRAPPEYRAMVAENVAAMRLDRSSARVPTPCDALKRITAPVLVVAGANSPPGLRGAASIAARCFGDGRLLTIAGAGHWVPLDQPAAFNAAALRFIDKAERRLPHPAAAR